jgi:5-methylcytosine-specific restriction protein A
MRYCVWPKCSIRVPRGYCPAHARRRDVDRGTPTERGYTARWHKRAAAFRARYPLCGDRPAGLAPVRSQCRDAGRVTPGDAVDHVTPHRGDPGLFWDELNNWQTLCAACHSAKTIAGL